MVVGQHAAVDAGGTDGREVLRAHAVIDALWLRSSASGHRCFQVDDACVWLATFELIQRNAPDIVEIDRVGNRAIESFCQPDIIAGFLDVVFVKPRIARMRQYKVNAAGGHDIATEKQLQRIGNGCHGTLRISRIAWFNSKCLF
jgi:hypothetical protein